MWPEKQQQQEFHNLALHEKRLQTPAQGEVPTGPPTRPPVQNRLSENTGTLERWRMSSLFRDLLTLGLRTQHCTKQTGGALASSQQQVRADQIEACIRRADFMCVLTTIVNNLKKNVTWKDKIYSLNKHPHK